MNSDSKVSLKFVTSPKTGFSSHKATLSENRYQNLSEDSQIQPVQEFSLNEIMPKLNTHNRVLSQPFEILTPEVLFFHRRQQSLAQRPLGQLFDTSRASPKQDLDLDLELEQSENFQPARHSRKISDCDMVVFRDYRDTFNSGEIVKKSLPVFGSNPCSAYCRVCDKEVHTKVEFENKPSLPFNFLDFVSSFFACCGEPAWLLKLRVHKCRHCGSVLAKGCR